MSSIIDNLIYLLPVVLIMLMYCYISSLYKRSTTEIERIHDNIDEVIVFGVTLFCLVPIIGQVFLILQICKVVKKYRYTGKIRKIYITALHDLKYIVLFSPVLLLLTLFFI